MNYLDFLKTKIEVARSSGFTVDPGSVHPALLPHQRDIVRWAVEGGCRALFESFGLGKSVQQLEILRQITRHEHGRGLIVAPLDVRLEFQDDAKNLLGIGLPYVRTMAEVRAAEGDILITNYERVRDGDIDPEYFVATSLDEASVLRSYGSKTYQEFLTLFKDVPYRFVATATPSPNRLKELIHYAGYLGIMDTGQALTRFFQRDSSKANNLTLYPHKEDEFWLWVSTWAVFVTKPSDITGNPADDEGYILPPIDIRWHEVAACQTSDRERDGQGLMFRDANAGGLPAAAREKRESLEVRIARAREIIAEDPDEHYILWHDTDAERDEIKRTVPAATIITGTMDLDLRAEQLYQFRTGEIPILATKRSISASGSNFQAHCHRAVFVGIDHKFHDFIQAVHRIHRFLQAEPVRIDVIYTEAERGIRDSLLAKWAQHDLLVTKMTDIIRKYGLSAATRERVLQRHIGVEEVKVEGGMYRAYNADCVEETARMETDSVDLICTSIPFGNHYEYCASYNDFGHNEDNGRFFEQMDFLSPELLRVLRPGRIFACHVKDRVLFGNATGTGMPEIDPFHAHCIGHYLKHGFHYMGMIHVDTDVVRENNQTYRLGWSEQCKDGSKMGIGCPEYILLFRKLPSDRSTAYADIPVVKSKEEYSRGRWQLDAHAHWRSSGNRLMRSDEIAVMPVETLQKAYREFSRTNVYDYRAHVELAEQLDRQGKLPAVFMVVAPASVRDDIWDDINRMRTLNTTQSMKGKQLHVCPLQLDICERIIDRFSNPGEVVYDPFGGIGSVGYQAIKSGRRAILCELSADYFRDMCGYLALAESEASAPMLFDMADLEAAAG